MSHLLEISWNHRQLYGIAAWKRTIPLLWKEFKRWQQEWSWEANMNHTRKVWKHWILTVWKLEGKSYVWALQKKCVQHEKLKHWFPLKNESPRNIKTRKSEKFKISKALTNRYKNSSIPYMRRLLNDEHSKMLGLCRWFYSIVVPVNFK